MPASLAHFQFGREVLCSLDETVRAAVLTYPKEYDIGQQGPDVFFFYQPYRRTWTLIFSADGHGTIAWAEPMITTKK